MGAFVSLVVGAVIGWLGSLAMRTGTRAGILLDIAVGAAAGILGPLLFGSDYLFDVVLAAALAAMIALALLHLFRRLAPIRT